MTDSSDAFRAAHDFEPMTLQEMEHYWNIFRFGFNDAASKGGFKKFVDASVGDEMLTVCVQDVSRSASGIMHLDLILSIWEGDDTTSYELTCNLDPHEKQGPAQTELPVIRFEKTPEGVVQLINRCRAEILAAVGPDQGTAYLTALQTQGGATGQGGPVVH